MTVKARIYQPARTAMQQGRAKTHAWVLEWEPSEARRAEPLMGWIGSGDTRRQIRLTFDTQDAAVAYAKERDIPYVVQEPKSRSVKVKSYADNFRW